MATDLVAVEADATALEADPVGYMAVVLNRAKSWLAEAQSIDAVRDQKALAVGYESVIREKELAFDAQLAATEIVRRCERRMGELVKQGQARGEIRRPGEVVARANQHGPVAGGDVGRVQHLRSPTDYFPDGTTERANSYALADAPEELGLDRSVCLRDIVNALSGAGVQGAIHAIFIADKFGSGDPDHG